MSALRLLGACAVWAVAYRQGLDALYTTGPEGWDEALESGVEPDGRPSLLPIQRSEGASSLSEERMREGLLVDSPLGHLAPSLLESNAGVLAVAVPPEKDAEQSKPMSKEGTKEDPPEKDAGQSKPMSTEPTKEDKKSKVSAANPAPKLKLIDIDKIIEKMTFLRTKTSRPEVLYYATQAESHKAAYYVRKDKTADPLYAKLYKKEAMVYATLADIAYRVDGKCPEEANGDKSSDFHLLYDYANTLLQLRNFDGNRSTGRSINANTRKRADRANFAPEFKYAEDLNDLLVTCNALSGFLGYNKFFKAFNFDHTFRNADARAQVMGKEEARLWSQAAGDIASTCLEAAVAAGFDTVKYHAERAIKNVAKSRAATSPGDSALWLQRALEDALIAERGWNLHLVEDTESKKYGKAVEVYAKALLALAPGQTTDVDRKVAKATMDAITKHRLEFQLRDSFMQRFKSELDDHDIAARTDVVSHNEEKGPSGVLASSKGVLSSTRNLLGAVTGLNGQA